MVVIRRLVADLNLPVRIEALPTVREPDGLAMSSRNALLSPSERARALALLAALRPRARARRGGRALGRGRSLAAAERALRARGVEPEYVALVDPETLEPLAELRGEALLAIAAGRRRAADRQRGPARRRTPAQPAQTREGEAIATCSA